MPGVKFHIQKGGEEFRRQLSQMEIGDTLPLNSKECILRMPGAWVLKSNDDDFTPGSMAVIPTGLDPMTELQCAQPLEDKTVNKS